MKRIVTFGPNAISKKGAALDDSDSVISSDSASEFKFNPEVKQINAKEVLRSVNSSQISHQINEKVGRCQSLAGDSSPQSGVNPTSKRFNPRRKRDSNLINFRKESNSMHNIINFAGKSRTKLFKKEALSPQQMRSFNFKYTLGHMKQGSHHRFDISNQSQYSNSKQSKATSKKQYSKDDTSVIKRGARDALAKKSHHLDKRQSTIVSTVQEKRQKCRNNGGKVMINQYLVEKQLGKGAFAKVLLCRDIKTNVQFAIKQMNKKELMKKKTGGNKNAYECVKEE